LDLVIEVRAAIRRIVDAPLAVMIREMVTPGLVRIRRQERKLDFALQLLATHGDLHIRTPDRLRYGAAIS
jgi:hypothetical protein